MGRKGYSSEQIINKLREAELLVYKGSTIVETNALHSVSDFAKPSLGK